jgi:hypothetical protein
MFVDDFVKLNFSDRNFLNLGPNPDTNSAFHGVCPAALTIPLKTARTNTSPHSAERAEGGRLFAISIFRAPFHCQTQRHGHVANHAIRTVALVFA